MFMCPQYRDGVSQYISVRLHRNHQRPQNYFTQLVQHFPAVKPNTNGHVQTGEFPVTVASRLNPPGHLSSVVFIHPRAHLPNLEGNQNLPLCCCFVTFVFLLPLLPLCSPLCYSSDRQLSLDLVNVGRQRLDFLPMLEHSGTYRESAMHTGTFAQEIITLVHQVKGQHSIRCACLYLSRCDFYSEKGLPLIPQGKRQFLHHIYCICFTIPYSAFYIHFF